MRLNLKRLHKPLLMLTLLTACFISVTPSILAESSFPRTVMVNGKPVTIEQKPVRIAAASGDIADIVFELVDVDRVVLVPMHQDNPIMYRHHDKVQHVPGRIAGATSLDPEAVLAYDPDLIVITLTHGAENDALKLLAMSGIPIVSFSDWSSFDALKANIALVGEVLGEEDKAAQVIAEIDRRLTAVEEQIAGAAKPSVLPLSVVSPSSNKPYLLGPTSFNFDLLLKAGGTFAGTKFGVTRTILATMEQLIQADPDYLLLSDWVGNGIETYSEFLGHPGMQAVTAVAEGNIIILPYRELWHTLDAIDGLEKVAAALHPDRF